MIIRQVEEGDNALLPKIIRRVFEEHNAPKAGTVYSDPTTDNLYELFQLPKSLLWVADLDGEVAGCCGIYPTSGLPRECTELVKFYLAEWARGRGVGKTLMDRCILTAREFGYSQIYIESLPEFSKAVRIYEKLGFVRLDQPLGDSGHSGCNIWMIKNLTDEIITEPPKLINT